MKDDISTAIRNMRNFGNAAQNLIDVNLAIFDEVSQSQKPEPDFLCACNGKACDGICRAKSGHFKGGDASDGGCTAAYRQPKPKAARRPRR